MTMLSEPEQVVANKSHFSFVAAIIPAYFGQLALEEIFKDFSSLLREQREKIDN